MRQIQSLRAEQSRAEQSRAEQSRAEQRLGNLYGMEGGNYAGNVYGRNGLAPALLSMQGGGRQPHVIETEYIPYDDYNSKVCEEPIMPTLTTNCGSSATRNGVKVIKSIKIRQATKDGFILCELGGGGGFGISILRDTQRKGDRERKDMPDSDNGEHP